MTKTAGWVMVSMALVGASLALGCGPEERMDVRPYTDSAGRSCNVDLEDISQTASCDVDPSTVVTCAGSEEPSFVLDDGFDFDTDIWTLRSCSACIDRPARMTYIRDCATVECVEDADCLKTPYTCRGGLCQHE